MECAVGSKVGFMVRGESKASAQTQILFCTYGVILRRLQVWFHGSVFAFVKCFFLEQEDPNLNAVDFIILDEVHGKYLDENIIGHFVGVRSQKRRRVSQNVASKVILPCHCCSKRSRTAVNQHF
jgi:ATP-dependent helicase HrpB